MRQKKEATPISRKDRAFFEKFLTDYEKFTRYQARKYKCPGISADDIYQEAALRLMGYIPTLRRLNHNQTCSYIAETVRTSFYDLQKKEKKHAHLSMDEIWTEVVEMEQTLVPDLFLRQELRRLRKDLPSRQWVALKGKYIYGYSQEELGKQLDIAPDSVRTFLSRARKLARAILFPEKVTGGDDHD